MPDSLLRWLFCVLCLCLFSACSKPTETALPNNTKVLILGDSLTQGVGASSKDVSYPSLLQQQSGWNVINAGVSGNTSAQALERLPALLEQHQPQLVVIGIGGNDFLQRISNSQTENNIRQSIVLSKKSGAKVLLIAVPELTLAAAMGHLSDHAMYERLAQEQGVYLLEDAWSDILSDQALRADQVHANDAGYRAFNGVLVKKLERIGWLQ